jgi:hypothetical protein
MDAAKDIVFFRGQSVSPPPLCVALTRYGPWHRSMAATDICHR